MTALLTVLLGPGDPGVGGVSVDALVVGHHEELVLCVLVQASERVGVGPRASHSLHLEAVGAGAQVPVTDVEPVHIVGELLYL